MATLPRSTRRGPDQADRADHQEVGVVYRLAPVGAGQVAHHLPCSLLVVKTT